MTSSAEDLDAELRAAAFESLRRITDASGGVITRDQLTEGFQFQGQRVPFADRGRGIWRPGHLGNSGAALSVITSAPKPGQEPPYDDGATSTEGWLAYKYQRKHEDSWDNQALRRAYTLQLPIIYFRGIIPAVFSAIFPMYVVEDEREEETFRLASVGVTVEDPGRLQSQDASLVKSYMLQVVKRRLHQHKFRELVMAAYGRRCSVCRLTHNPLLDAAHIIEDRDELGKPEVPNGLALCKIHHGAFDASILGITPDYRVEIREDILEEKDGPMLKHGLQEMHGGRIHLPRSAALRPNGEYLATRYDRFLAA